MLRSLPSTAVFLDTDLVVNAVIKGLHHTEVCRLALQSVVDSGQRVFYSSVLKVEYLQAIRRLATRQQLPANLYTEFELHRWSEHRIRERWITSGFEALRDFFEVFPFLIELPLESAIINQCPELMARYSMSSLDATHLATALHYEIPVFWTCDDHFQRVEELAVEIIRDPA